MQNLTRAHDELFKRNPDERFSSISELCQHCYDMKQWSRENFLGLGRWLELKGYGVSSRFGDITDQVQPTDW